MLNLLLFPFTMVFAIFGGVVTLIVSIFRGVFRMIFGTAKAAFSLSLLAWPFLLIGGVITLVAGLIRSIWPLIGVGILVFICAGLYQMGKDHAEGHEDDAFTRFVNEIRARYHRT